MKRPILKGMIAVGALSIMLVSCGGSGGDQAALTDAQSSAIKERQATFKSIGKSFKTIRGQLEGSSPDFAAIGEAAGAINASASKLAGLFPEGTSVDSGADTEALATIWETPEDFEKAAAALIKASTDMQGLAASGDVDAVKGGVGAIGSACKTCHETFRLDKD